VSHWARIRFFMEELDRTHQTYMWRILTCLYLSRTLQECQQ
jgi:hypothetical protein